MDYKTVRQAAEAEYVIKRSRFIGHIAPVETDTQATAFLEQIRTKHWDASHNVYAYVLRAGQIRRYSDDGEPQGTAGIPVLDVLQKEGLTDCALVVTRYFGGVLLGAGDLVRAYSRCAKLAVDAGGIAERVCCALLRLRCPYDFYGKLAALIPESGGAVDDVRYEEAVSLDFYVPLPALAAFEAKLLDAGNGVYRAEKIGEGYFDKK